MFSVPAAVLRSIVSVGDAPAEIAVVTAGDHKKRPIWSGEIVRDAARAGFALDHAGYLAAAPTAAARRAEARSVKAAGSTIARRATSYDVARRAGVAQSTVSRCFQGDGSISPATRAGA